MVHQIRLPLASDGDISSTCWKRPASKIRRKWNAWSLENLREMPAATGVLFLVLHILVALSMLRWTTRVQGKSRRTKQMQSDDHETNIVAYCEYSCELRVQRMQWLVLSHHGCTYGRQQCTLLMWSTLLWQVHVVRTTAANKYATS